MNFFILYQKNQIEETNKAKNMFVGLKVTMDGVERKNYYAPLSWIIGCLRYAISPVVALVRTGIDFYTRNISPEHLKETLNILEEALIQPNEFDYLVLELTKNNYKSSSSNELIKKLNHEAKLSEIIAFLRAPVNQGSRLQQDICHYTNLFCNKNKYTPFKPARDLRRNSIPSRTG